MTKTENLSQLAAALAKAQGKIKNAAREGENAHFGSRYATLASTWDACRVALAEHGLSVVQAIESDGSGVVTVETTLLHESGEYISARYGVRPLQDGPQAAGSVTTYARRYALAAMVGIAAEDDDDGERASGRAPQQPGTTPAKPTSTEPDPKTAQRQPLKREEKKDPESPPLEVERVREALRLTPPMIDAAKAMPGIGILLGAVPEVGRYHAMLTAWKRMKITGEPPADLAGFKKVHPTTLSLLYKALRDALAQFAGWVDPTEAADSAGEPERTDAVKSEAARLAESELDRFAREHGGAS